MNKRGSGTVFYLIAALLYLSKYVCAAIFGAQIATGDSVPFSAFLSYIGSGLTIFSVISLVVGVQYLIRAELENKRLK